MLKDIGQQEIPDFKGLLRVVNTNEVLMYVPANGAVYLLGLTCCARLIEAPANRKRTNSTKFRMAIICIKLKNLSH